MINEERKQELERSINDLTSKLQPVSFARDIPMTLTKLMFLKYAVDNYVGAKDIESMQKYAQVQKLFAMKDVEFGISAIFSVLELIDAQYELNGLLSQRNNIEDYARTLFGDSEKKIRKSASVAGFENVMDMLGRIDLEEHEQDASVGKHIVEYLVSIITTNSIRNYKYAESTTKPQLNKLVSKLLDVKADDVFCDIASGLGISTIDITKGAMPAIVNADIDHETATVSAMLYIMYGYKKIDVRCANSIVNVVEGVHGNRIFVDAPLGVKFKDEGTKYRDASLEVINKVMHHYIDDDGIAVITVPSGVLFQQNGQSIELKRDIISSGQVKAVIALPSMWEGTNIGTNLLVLTEKSRYEQTILIDATKLSINGKNKKDAAGKIALEDEVIERILDVIKKPRNEKEFSYIADTNKLIANNYNLLPANYIEHEILTEELSLNDIEKELKDLYSQLNL